MWHLISFWLSRQYMPSASALQWNHHCCTLLTKTQSSNRFEATMISLSCHGCRHIAHRNQNSGSCERNSSNIGAPSCAGFLGFGVGFRRFFDAAAAWSAPRLAAGACPRSAAAAASIVQQPSTAFVAFVGLSANGTKSWLKVHVLAGNKWFWKKSGPL